MKNINGINIIFEDDYLLVIDKPAGLVVHPGAGEETNTLVDWLKEYIPNFMEQNWPSAIRPGIVHRLDKDTSGLLIIAKTPAALAKLQEEFKNHQIEKEYTTLVWGKVEPPAGAIETPIHRHHRQRRKMAVSYFSDESTKTAITKYETIKNFQTPIQLTLLEVRIMTGRMHQIRVHLKYLGHPIIGDPVYFNKASRQASRQLNLSRQFLHASQLSFRHPETNQLLHFSSELPKDLREILKMIK